MGLSKSVSKREKDCIKLVKFGSGKGGFVPDRRFCKNNCAESNCDWFKR